MRKITSKKELEKKQRRNQIIIGIVLIFVMFFSVVGYGFVGKSYDAKEKDYNGFAFLQQDNLWFTQIGDFLFVFNNHPTEIQNVKIEGELKTLENYYSKPVYIHSDNREAEIEIYSNLNAVVQRFQYACLEDKICEGDFPIKNCNDLFIIITENKNETQIIQQDNCVFIEGKDEELTKLTDEFLFRILGIKNN